MKKILFSLLFSFAYFGYSQTILMTTLNYTASSSASNIAVCSNIFHDDGGSGGNYSLSQYAVHTMYSKLTTTTTITNYKLSVFTNSCILAPNDTLYMYDGEDLTAALLATFTGTTLGNPSFMSSSGAVTFKFRSDASGTAPGWAFTLNCLTPSLTAISTPTMNKGKTYSVTINGTRTSFLSSSPINKVFLALGPDSIAATSVVSINDTVLTANFNIPCLFTPSVTSLNLVAYNFKQGTLSLNNMVTPLTISSTLTNTNVTCNSMCNGIATGVPVNGNTPFTYTWLPSGGNASTASGLCSGTYSLNITDQTGCVTSTNVNITQPSFLTGSPSQNNVTCFGGSNGSASITVGGGIPPYTYFWTPSSATTSFVTNISSGTHTCTVTDANGCTLTQTLAIAQPAVINGLITPTQVSCFAASNGAASISASGGTPPLTYSWSPSGSITMTALNLSAGVQSCVVTDANSCIVTKTVNITQPASMSATTNQNNVLCFGGNSGSSTVSVAGGVSPYTYSWVPSGGTSSVAVNLASQNFTCIITDANSCATSKTISITQPSAISSTSNQNSVTCFGGNNGSATLNVSGGTTPYTYTWTPSAATTSTINNLSAGNFTCNVLDANGCSYTSTLSITQPASITCAVSGQSTLCLNQTFTATSSYTGAIAPVTYTWTELPSSTISSASTFTSNPTVGAHSYYLSMTDANNCSAVSNTISLTVNSLNALTGVVSVSANAVAGDVVLYKFQPTLVKFDSVTYQPLNALGEFTFNVQDANNYLIKCIPTANSLQITYAPNAISWKNAVTVTHGCISNTNQNINVIPLTNLGSGPGLLAGTITEGIGYGQRTNGISSPGAPIKGVIVKGGRNPGGDITTQSKTNAAGQYTLSGLPSNLVNQDYFVLVDIPGLDTNTTYHRVITSTNFQFNDLDFVVDSAKVTPLGNFVSVKTVSLDKNKIRLYPNPTNGVVNIEFDLFKPSNVTIEVMDVLGRSIKTILPVSYQNENEIKIASNLSGIRQGVYFVKIKIDNSEITTKLIITH